MMKKLWWVGWLTTGVLLSAATTSCTDTLAQFGGDFLRQGLAAFLL